MTETPVVQADTNYHSVQDQIDETEVSVEQSRNAIRSLQHEIEAHRTFISQAQSQLRKLRAKRAVFARAKFQLEQIEKN